MSYAVLSSSWTPVEGFKCKPGTTIVSEEVSKQLVHPGWHFRAAATQTGHSMVIIYCPGIWVDKDFVSN